MAGMDWAGAVVGIPATALGVFFGLLGSGLVSWYQDKGAFRAMLRSIAGEAQSNNVVLKDSCLANYKNGIVLRDFSTAAVIQCIGNPLFVKHAEAMELERIYEYLRAISLANAYRAKAETLRLDDNKKRVDEWLESLIEVWGRNLVDCGNRISAVADLGAS